MASSHINRLFIGILLLIVVSSSYYFELDLYLIISILFLIAYDFYYIKIINNFFLYLLLILAILAIYIPQEFLRDLYIFESFLILSILFSKKLIKYFFVLSLFIFCLILFFISLTDRNLFYLIIFISFFNDTVAYLSGKFFAGKLIIPNISPNKTWSGTLISFFATSFILLLLNFSILLSMISALSLFLGDIFFSFVKRYLQIKDFSSSLGGHGGILDRLDSMFLLAIIFQIYLVF